MITVDRKGEGEVEEAQMTRELCEQWQANPLRNPMTGRKIKEGGRIWKTYEKMCREVAVVEDVVVVVVRRLEDIEKICLNHQDPVTFDEWKDLNEDELQELVLLDSEIEGRKYGLMLDTAFGIYRVAIEGGKRARNPISMDRDFTDAEIGDILAKMKRRDAKFRAPEKVVPKLKEGVNLVMDDDVIEVFGFVYHFVHIRVVDARRTILYYGCVPGWVETNGVIGSADTTSGVLLSNLWDLWNERKWFVEYKEPLKKCECKIAALNPKRPMTPAYWLHRNTGTLKRQVFIEMCRDVSDALSG